MPPALGSSAHYEPYSRTRNYYEAVGIAALKDSTSIWGPENPSLMMVKAIRSDE